MKTRIFDRYGRVAAIDHKYTGEEPKWDNCASWDGEKFMKERSRMFNFYNYYCASDGPHTKNRDTWPERVEDEVAEVGTRAHMHIVANNLWTFPTHSWYTQPRGRAYPLND